MTELQTIEQQIQSEITISADGKCYISAKGAARLVGLQNNHILGVSRFPKKLAETFTQQGLDPVSRPFSDIALTLIAEYYAYNSQSPNVQAKRVFRTLAAVGARQWMQTVTGWKAPDKMTKLPAQQLITLAQAALEHGRMTEYAEDYPGLQNILDHGRQEATNPLIDGMMTVEQALLSKGIKPTVAMKRAVGGYVAIQWRQYKWAAPEKASTARGPVSAYPASFLVPCIDNALRAL